MVPNHVPLFEGLPPSASAHLPPHTLGIPTEPSYPPHAAQGAPPPPPSQAHHVTQSGTTAAVENDHHRMAMMVSCIHSFLLGMIGIYPLHT